MAGTSVNAFLATLASSLSSGGSEDEIFLSRITTLTGEEIETADFAIFGKGTITIDPLSSANIEFCSFTGVDSDNVSFTGAVRGLSALDYTASTSRAKYHPVGTKVIIAFGTHNLLDLVNYVADIVEGEVGTATDTTSGTSFITENLGARPRSMAALVSQQTVPDMTLKVNPFSIHNSYTNSVIEYAGGNTSTISAPSSNPRIDLIVYNITSSALAVRTGSESATPSAPASLAGDVVLASVYLRTSSTAIYERDQTTNSYIREWFALPSFSPIPAGVIFDYAGSSVPTGWLACDGSAVSRTTYAALFSAIGTTWGVGDNSTTFNVPDFRGRTTIGSGTGTVVLTFASRSSDTITVTGATNANNNTVQTGQIVNYVTSGTPITGLTSTNNYYVIRVANDQFKLASTLANAQAGTAISLSSDGTGTQTFTLTLSTRTLADRGGEETHAITSTETLAHTHTFNVLGTNASGANPYNATGSVQGSVTTSSFGGNAAMNNMQPFSVVTKIIKY